MRLTIKIGGQAGQGIESGGAGLTKALMHAGLHVYGFGDYMSRIRGGHNFYILTMDDTHEVWSNSESIYILVALDQDTLKEHISEVITGGSILVDDDFHLKEQDIKTIEKNKLNLCKLPINKIAGDIGGNKIYANTALLGATAALLDLDFEFLNEVIKQNFEKKSSEIADKNVQVAFESYVMTKKKYLSGFKWKLSYRPHKKQRMLIHGNDCFSMGAFAAGCRFVSAYPMTPATTIIEWFAKHHKYGIVTKHVEDEISAVCMAIGANHAGVRALTATSGGGFCLMVEALGFAGMTETPVVVMNVQRGGPSTGLPTRNEQSDLLFLLNAGHGEFPRILLAPGTHEDCYLTGIKAMNMAEKYQTPVLVLSDLQQSSALKDIDSDFFNLNKVVIDRGKLLTKKELEDMTEPYLRFKFTEDGISPRAFPGHPKTVYSCTTDEHDEKGHITEDKENRNKMQSKRMKKEITALKDMKLPVIYGTEDADTTLVCWGGNYGVCKDTVDANNHGAMNLLYFQDMWPFPKEQVKTLLSKIKKPVLVESNYSSQLGKFLTMTTGFEIKNKILRSDGRSFYPEEIKRELERIG
ncbi:MAG: 2-oxoacid:acceptor oxidoreductase subunit alpha [Candidatus Melainabacteria bacterium]|nr:2-oxoacid:acceptor oxidoreductase subunit alpha [Candidatus Melainabacteria bacterium]